ncbi:MAG: M23 family metallopeptidase [Flavobacteriales bacterium]|nr:M23 family metallopeptidase [Flavobacteriales bacterium]
MEQASKKEIRREKRRKAMKKLRLKYRLVILDEGSFAEKFSLRLSPLNLFIWLGMFALLLIGLTTMLIAYTPLREFIPGYPDGSEREALIDNRIKVDSLEAELVKYERYVKNIQGILNGDRISDTLVEDSPEKNYANINFELSPADSVLRQKIEAEEKYEIRSGQNNIVLSNDNMYGIFFFTPLQGEITQSFNKREGHFGIDISAPSADGIKATLDGTVVFADWSSDGGHEIHIQHSNNLVSVYKHNAVLLKKTGDVVKAGDVIAIAGNSGELSDGPHLHFELWHRGKPIDPQNYLIF